jgi:SAM-dependent methyltransferase
MNLEEMDIDDIYKEVLSHLRKTWEWRSGRKAEETAQALLSVARARHQVEIIKRYIPEITGKKLLEIGSGYGMFLAVARKDYGTRAFGVEPSGTGIYTNTYELARKLLTRAGISPVILRAGWGENLPYKDRSFDVVFSYHVLEHTFHQEEIIGEAVRVLAPGGTMIMVAPNYGSFWESHYGLPWVPYLPKILAKIYVGILGRDPGILDEINFVYKRNLEKYIEKFPEMGVVSWGEDYFREVIMEGKVNGESTEGTASKILKVTKSLLGERVIVFIASRFDAYTPLVLVVRKGR